MFEKISGFFKQFGRRRKRQSGETTIMQSREPGTDDFGLDDEFDDLGTFGDTGDSVGALSMEDEAESEIGDAFSDFNIGAEEGEISTGGTDFDEKTVSDEISGMGETDFGETGDDFAEAFGAGEETLSLAGAVAAPTPKAASFLKSILTVLVAAVVAVGAGAAFQIYAWTTVGTMVGLVKADDKVALDPQTQLNDEKRQKRNLNKEMAEFKNVGGPAEVQALKKQIAETRDAQGSMEELESEFKSVKQKEAEYDELVNKIKKLETDINKTTNAIKKIAVDIEGAKRRVIDLARQTEGEYERFRFELVRAELGQRLLIELQLQYIASFRADIAKLEKRLSRLSTNVLASADTSDTSENRQEAK